MDWMLWSYGAPSFVFIPLGTYYNNQYYISDHCSTYLEELATQLDNDDKKTHWRRRGLGFVDIINTDLKHILIHCNDHPYVFRSTVKLLVKITTPIEFLIFEEIPDQKNYSSFIISELIVHLCKAKEAFLDSTATRVVIDYVRRLLMNQPLSFEETECGNTCLLLLRNLLHGFTQRPDNNPPDNSQQNQFVCNLFAQAFDELLLDMLVSPHRDEWIAAIAQIITLFFKDRPVEDIQNRLSTLVGSDTFESSADDDNISLNEEIIDTFEVMTLSSYSSTPRKRNIKEKIKVEYLPTDDNISKLLERFVVDLMPKGFNVLVGNLHHQLLRHEDVPLDKAQFFWLLAYFLGFAPILNLNMKCIRDVLNIDILCYLTWEAHREAEKLEEWYQRSLGIKPLRLHRCVTAIREYLLVLEINSNLGDDSLEGSEESQSFQDWSNRLRIHLPAMRDLRQLFLLLIRQYNPNFQDRQYLRDVITANNLLLLTLNRAHGSPEYDRNFDFKEHLQQFCSITILSQYGAALEDFRENGTVVNDSILTLLRYLNDDLGRTDLLCEPVIIFPFSKIWEETSNILDDWRDLIACALHNFMSNYHARGGGDLRTHFRTVSGLWDQKVLQAKKAIYQFDTTPTDQSSVADNAPQADLQLAIDELRSLGFQKQLDWIQSSLLTTCSAQLGAYAGREFRNPIACLSLRKNISCPIVPWTDMEASALRSIRFCYLLNRIGLLPHSSQDSFYPCIPREWSANILYDVALIFGPIDSPKLNFDLSLLSKTEQISNPDLLFEQTAGSLSEIWEPDEETESSTSVPEVSSRVLQWIEEQSGIRVWSPEKHTDVSTLDDGLTEMNEKCMKSVSMKEISYV